MMYIVQEAVNQTIYMTEQAEQKLQEIAPGLIKQVSLTVRLGYGRIKWLKVNYKNDVKHNEMLLMSVAYPVSIERVFTFQTI